MAEMPPLGDPTGIIIIRLWREPDHEAELRARIATVRDVHRDEVENVVVSSTDEILEHVRRFVASFTAA
jgi:hypothetical protein